MDESSEKSMRQERGLDFGFESALSNAGPTLLVRESVQFWNPLVDSLLRVDAKLTKIGFRYCNGVVSIQDSDEEWEAIR